jgi:hypothetical protein
VVVDTERTVDRRTARRWRGAAAAAVPVVLLVTAATVFVTSSDDGGVRTKPAGQTPSTTPSPTALTPPTTVVRPQSTIPGDRSTQGALLPDGAPSMPHSGELVASVRWLEPPPSDIYHSYDLYADGRLIWFFDRDNQYVEQRLTPEGVARVRSEFLASGLFDPAQPPSSVPPCTLQSTPVAPALPLQVCVRGDDGRLLSARETPVPDMVQLVSYLKTLDSSLPESEWSDKKTKPYVASRIAVCMRTFVGQKNGTAVQVPNDLSKLLSLFPAQAAALLEGRDEIGRLPNIGDGGSCFELTLEEARTLRDELLAPSGRGSHAYYGIVLNINYQFDAIQPAGNPRKKGTRNVAFITFNHLTPHGQPV